MSGRRERIHNRPRSNQAPYHDRNGSSRHQKSIGKKAYVAPRKRIRDLERLLAKNDKLPAHVKIEKQRELTALRQAFDRDGEAKLRTKMVGKYHMVRFFDRKKADRRLKKWQKLFNDCTDEEQKRALSERVHAAEVDLNYSLFFPLLRKYVMLFPKGIDTNSNVESERDNGDTGPKGNVEVWRMVESAMLDGADALQALKQEDLKAGTPHQSSANLDFPEHQVPLASNSRKPVFSGKGVHSSAKPDDEVEEPDDFFDYT